MVMVTKMKSKLAFALPFVAVCAIAQADSKLGTNTNNLDTTHRGVINIENIRKNIDTNVTAEQFETIRKTNQDIFKQLEVKESIALPDDVSKSVKVVDQNLPKPKVPSYIDDRKLEAQRGFIDLEKITKEYNDILLKDDKRPADELSGFEAGRAYLFISSSIPKTTLENLLNDAGRMNIAVFLNGNIGDDPLKFAGTQAFMQDIDVKTPPELFIHPDAFHMFKITRVPALVVAASDVKNNLDEQGCAALEDYDIVYGDLKLSYHMTQIFEKASSPDIKDIARLYMKHINVSDAN